MKTVAIFASDVHLSGRTPAGRDEKNWMEAQERILKQLSDLANVHKCPIIYCGDIFDRWNTPVSIVNWAIRHLPPGHAIPGQHDLPFHDYSAIKDSAYWTLVEAGIIKNLEPGKSTPIDITDSRQIFIYGFPWDVDIVPPVNKNQFNVAVVHKYIWIAGKSYYAAGSLPAQTKLDSTTGGEAEGFRSVLAQYDAAFFGDNHIPFIYSRGGLRVINCGCLIRRSRAERNIQPVVWMLCDDLEIRPFELDVSNDRWLDPAVKSTAEIDELDDLLDELRSADEEVTCISYRDAIKHYIEVNHVRDGVKRVLLSSLEE